jgi:hypothetical protein
MKHIVTLFAVVSLIASNSVYAEAVSKKVCHEKNGKQVCKVIKTHEKLDGTKVPDKQQTKKKK